MDNRTLREIAWNSWLQNAATYLRYASLEGDELLRYQTTFKTDDLRKWAIDQANECIERANEKYDGPGSYAREVARPYIEALSGVSGLVRIVED